VTNSKVHPRNRKKISVIQVQTAAAKKSLRFSAGLKLQLKAAAKLVFETDLSYLEEFHLSIVVLSDDELLAINRTSLNHDYYTDIITFEIERSETALEAELYISVDRAKENAKKYRANIEEELIRLVVHGVLHLAGYSDKTSSSKNQMRRRERWYLTQIRP
jgi:probable rRNA maturation factor